jgi:uncharacterized protein YjbI with pentapeptide repeats
MRELDDLITKAILLELIKENGNTAKGLDLSGTVFEPGIDLKGLNLEEIILNQTDFTGFSPKITSHGSPLEFDEIHEAHFEKTNLVGAHFDHAELQDAHFEEADLSCATINDAYLPDSHFERAKLIGAKLNNIDAEHTNFNSAIMTHVELNGASLSDANLHGTLLLEAQLKKSHLQNACLDDSYLAYADLQEANLDHASFKNVNLYRANLTGVYIGDAIFDNTTKLGEVIWGNYTIKEEFDGAFEIATQSYRRLKMWYADAGYHDIAAKFYYREKEANRKSIKLLSKHWNDRLATEFFRALFGYGERWWNVVFWIAGVVFVFALLYSLQPSSTFGDNLYFSAVSFIALGYGSWIKENVAAWVRVLGALETFIGFFLMTLLLTTFIRKWTR